MTATTPAAPADVARRLWIQAAGGSPSPMEIARATDRLSAELRMGLGRWIGAQGYAALQNRALGLARVNHPALDAVPSLVPGAARPSVPLNRREADQVAAGMIALMVEMIDLLSRILGVEMAMRLVENIGIRGPREKVPNEIESGKDD